jgi:hypothetical protein
MQVGDGMSENLWRAMDGFATREPERAKSIIDRCANSEIPIDWDFAAMTASSLVDYDYPFVRDTLIKIINYPYVGAAPDLAEFKAIPRLMRDRLTDGQIADFNYHFILSGGEHELSAAEPGR